MRIGKLFAGLAMLAALCILACNPPVDTQEQEDDKEQISAKPSESETITADNAPAGLKERIKAAVGNVRKRQLLTSNAFWTIFHGILGMGPGVTLMHDTTGVKVNAIDHIAGGGELRGLKFHIKREGLDVQIGPSMVGQGHQDQFTAEMTQWSMPATRVFRVDGQEFSFMDFVKFSQAHARVTQRQELSWTIIQVGHHIGTDAAWTNAYGEKLNYEDMIRYELNESIENAACGGTHRLFGLTWSYYLHLLEGGKTEGVWKEVVDKNNKYRDIARKFQNPDGSLSTGFFKEKGNSQEMHSRIYSTGHTVEWLALALNDEELKEQWVQDAVNALCMMILGQGTQAVESGAMYHSMHGLIMYYARVYGMDEFVPEQLAMPLPATWRYGGKKAGKPIGG